MEWREIKRADQKKTIGLWVHNEEHWKQRGITHVETYYCPLRNRCGCRAQLRITRAPSVAVLEWSGGPLTYKLCHSEDASKNLTARRGCQRVQENVNTRAALIAKARSDKTDLFRNFADKISAATSPTRFQLVI